MTAPLLTYDEAAARWNVPRKTLIEAVREGALPVLQWGQQTVRLSDEAIEKWLEGQEQVRALK